MSSLGQVTEAIHFHFYSKNNIVQLENDSLVNLPIEVTSRNANIKVISVYDVPYYEMPTYLQLWSAISIEKINTSSELNTEMEDENIDTLVMSSLSFVTVGYLFSRCFKILDGILNDYQSNKIEPENSKYYMMLIIVCDFLKKSDKWDGKMQGFINKIDELQQVFPHNNIDISEIEWKRMKDTLIQKYEEGLKKIKYMIIPLDNDKIKIRQKSRYARHMIIMLDLQKDLKKEGVIDSKLKLVSNARNEISELDEFYEKHIETQLNYRIVGVFSKGAITVKA